MATPETEMESKVLESATEAPVEETDDEGPAPTEEGDNEESKPEPAAADKTAAGDTPADGPESVDADSHAGPVQDLNSDEEAGEEESEVAEQHGEPVLGPVSEAIREMAQSSTSQRAAPEMTKGAAFGETSGLLWTCARDIMQEQVVWASPDDTVQQALTKLQQHDIGYLAVGRQEVLEGIVSKADVAGVVSPYLRPMFAKWRRPSDDATLQIKLKWIMSRPVRTARPETPLATVLENMCRFGGRALPVVDERGKVQGLVTAFDIFQMLLNSGANVPTAGKAPQGPPL